MFLTNICGYLSYILGLLLSFFLDFNCYTRILLLKNGLQSGVWFYLVHAFLCFHSETATQLKSWPVNINCPEEGEGPQSSQEMTQTS